MTDFALLEERKYRYILATHTINCALIMWFTKWVVGRRISKDIFLEGFLDTDKSVRYQEITQKGM